LVHNLGGQYDIHYITLANNCRVAYIDEGSGDQVLFFIHGLATYGLSWHYQVEGLKHRYRCIAIDLPGNGHSDRGNYPYGINFFSGCVYDMIQRMGLKRVTIVGHSMGGQIAINLVAHEPAVAEKLILCASAGFERFNGMERSIYQGTVSFLDMFSSDENSLRKVIRSSFYRYPEQTDAMINDLIDIMHKHPSREYHSMIEACINGMLHEPVFDMLHQIQQPTLVMFGERDALIPNRLIHPYHTKQVAETGTKEIPDAVLRMVPQCGHFLQMEKPGVVNPYIMDFVG